MWTPKCVRAFGANVQWSPLISVSPYVGVEISLSVQEEAPERSAQSVADEAGASLVQESRTGLGLCSGAVVGLRRGSWPMRLHHLSRHAEETCMAIYVEH